MKLIAALLLALQTSLGAVNLSWNANTEPDLAGYRVYQGTAPGAYGTPIQAGNQVTYTLSGLSPGTYYFAITALDTSGNESGFSNEVSAVVMVPPPLPTIALSASPLNVQLGQTTFLSWTSTNATTVSIDQSVGAVSLSGTQSVSPIANTTYTATASSAGGSAVASVAVTVYGPPVSLTAPRSLQLTRNADNSSTIIPLTVNKDDCITFNGVKIAGGLNCP